MLGVAMLSPQQVWQPRVARQEHTTSCQLTAENSQDAGRPLPDYATPAHDSGVCGAREKESYRVKEGGASRAAAARLKKGAPRDSSLDREVQRSINCPMELAIPPASRLKKAGSAPLMAAMAMDWLDRQHPHDVEELGKGQFGEVVKAGPYAIKILKAGGDTETQLKEMAAYHWAEKQAHVIEAVGMDPTRRDMPLVMKRARTDLGRLVNDAPASSLMTYCRDAADGIRNLHVVGLSHNDVKAANVFLMDTPGGELEGVMGDLGFASGIGEVVKAGMGSPGSLAPEYMYDSIPAHPARDSFAFGVMLAEVFLRAPFNRLFANRENVSTEEMSSVMVNIDGKRKADIELLMPFLKRNMVDVEDSLKRILIPENVHPSVADPWRMIRLIKGCVNPDPAMRLETRAIMARLDAAIKGQRFSEALVAAYTAGLEAAVASATVAPAPTTAAAGARAAQGVVGGRGPVGCVARATDPCVGVGVPVRVVVGGMGRMVETQGPGQQRTGARAAQGVVGGRGLVGCVARATDPCVGVGVTARVVGGGVRRMVETQGPGQQRAGARAAQAVVGGRGPVGCVARATDPCVGVGVTARVVGGGVGRMVETQGPGQQRREAVAHSIVPATRGGPPVRTLAPAAQGAGVGRYGQEPAAPCPQTPILTTGCGSGVPDLARPVGLTARADRLELMYQAQREAVRAANSTAATAYAPHAAPAAPATLGSGGGGYGRAPAACSPQVPVLNAGGVAPGRRVVYMDEVRQRQAAR